MYAQVEKSKENKSSAVANSIVQKKSNEQGLELMDNRPKRIIQRVQYPWMLNPTGDTRFDQEIEDSKAHKEATGENYLPLVKQPEEVVPKYMYRVDTRRPYEIEKTGFEGREASQLNGSTQSNDGKKQEDMAFSSATFTGGTDDQILSELGMASSAGIGQKNLYRFKHMPDRVTKTEGLRGWIKDKHGTEGAMEKNVIGKVTPIEIEYYFSAKKTWIHLDGNAKESFKKALLKKDQNRN